MPAIQLFDDASSNLLVLPQRGLLLIGTLPATRALWAQIDASYPGIAPAGCILVEGAAPPLARMSGLPILGALDTLVELHSRLEFKLALVSLPSGGAMTRLRGRLAAGLAQLGIEHRFIPTLAEFLTGPGPQAAATVEPKPALAAATEAIPPRLRAAPRLDFTQLIGRTHYGLDRKAVASIITGKRVLITGAGGSIGSELARVCAGFNPESLILMERAENALFNIDHELGRHFPSVARRAVLHDIVDQERTLSRLVEHRPHVVFHSAAHKHVPLMEDHPSHAVDNNLFGTRSIADAAVATGAERFVMISSDKAVNPTSVMGATKRLAERYIAGLARTPSAGSTRLSMVRFGNVLGSACSVIPIWQQQIGEGGPVTVTDDRMTRYFMTIPEAATLVVQAAALSSDPGAAPVYVLDMGEPVRILDLAVRLISMHGFFPVLPEAANTRAARGFGESDPMQVVLSGIRPGEKLYEQLAYDAEQLRPTAHAGINAWAGVGSDDTPDIARMIAELAGVRRGGEKDAVLALIRRHVPEMRPALAQVA